MVEVEEKSVSSGHIYKSDLIIKINGKYTRNLTLQEANELITSSDMAEFTVRKQAATAEQYQTLTDDTTTITLDRSGGKKLGIQLANSAIPQSGLRCTYSSS